MSEEDYEVMDCYSPPGTKVRFAYPNNGWPGEGEAALKTLVLNKIYTVRYVYVASSYSRVVLDGVNGAYNTVLFAPVPDEKSAAVKTLKNLGYTYTDGAELWKPPLGLKMELQVKEVFLDDQKTISLPTEVPTPKECENCGCVFLDDQNTVCASCR